MPKKTKIKSHKVRPPSPGISDFEIYGPLPTPHPTHTPTLITPPSPQPSSIPIIPIDESYISDQISSKISQLTSLITGPSTTRQITPTASTASTSGGTPFWIWLLVVIIIIVIAIIVLMIVFGSHSETKSALSF